jgi:hypothetical protein
MTSDISICGKSEFCRELARIAEKDNMKANMMWSNYLNNQMLDMKKKQNKKNKKTNKKFALAAEKKLKEQLEKERKQNREKLEAYQRGVRNQRNDHLNNKQKNFLKKKHEDEKWKNDVIEDNARYYQMKIEKEQNKLNKYRDGLEEQIKNKRQTDQDRQELDKEISVKNRNYLIDDTWKVKHQEQIRDHLQTGLANQIHDKEEAMQMERKKKEAEDEQYKYDLQNANNADLRKREEIRNRKHEIYLEEIKKQENQQLKQRQLEDKLRNAEDDKVRQKLVEDHMRYLDAEKKRKALMEDHLHKIEGQMNEMEQKRKRDLVLSKKPHGTTLITKGDYVAYEPDLQANLDMVDLKKKNQQKIAEEDRKFADEVKQKNMESLERDRQREAEKLRVYQNGMKNQKEDYKKKIQKELEKLKDEDEKWKNDVNEDNARYYQMMNEKEAGKLNNYRKGLDEQVRQKQKKDQDESNLRREISARNRNYLIDDTWKVKHKEQIRDHLQAGLANQIHDKEEEKNWNRKKQEAEDEQYRHDLQNANNADLRKREEIRNRKHEIYLEEIKKQEMQNQKQRELENALRNAEDERVRQKLIEDHMRNLEDEKKKKAILDEHLKKVIDQKKEKIEIKKKKLILSKKPYGTTLITKGDNVKYFDYMDAMKMYPLRAHKKRRQNKK